MTRILWYTDGSTAGSVSGSVLSFGTAKSRPATRAAIYDAIANALIAAGFTQHNNATRDDVWVSTGESGGETIYLRTTLTSGQFVNFYVGTKIDGSNLLQGSIGGGTNAFERWDLGTSDQTFDYIILATKDFIWCNFRAVNAGSNFSANDQFNAFMGNVERDNLVNANILTSSADVSAGTFVSIPVTTNPSTNDYKPGDMVMIVSQTTGEAALAQTVRIVNVPDSSHIEVDSLASGYKSGAKIGACPLPVARFVSRNLDITDATSWYTPFQTPLIAQTSDLASAPGLSLSAPELSLGTTLTAQDGFGTSTTPNKRTRRFTCRSFEIASNTANTVQNGDYLLGRVPGVYGYPGSMSFYPNDTGTFNRASPTQRFLGMRMVTAGARNFMAGKSP